MRSLKIFGLAFLAVGMIILIGMIQLSDDQPGGIFFLFVGVCTFLGLAIDMTNHLKEKFRKNNVRKLQP